MNTADVNNQSIDDLDKKNAKTLKILILIVLAMFIFAFAQIELYGLFCKAVGVNSLSSRQKIDGYENLIAKNADISHAIENTIAKKKSDTNPVIDNRLITVRFDATVNNDLPWSFVPIDKKITVHPGELKTITYKVKNLTNEVITGQSIASVTPWQAEPFLSKLECFCHTKQTLQPGEEKEMPLLFTLSEDLPEEIGTLVVSYTFLNADKASSKKYQNKL